MTYIPNCSNELMENNGELTSPWMSLSFTSTSYRPSWRPEPLRSSTCPSTCAAARLLSRSLESPVGEATSSDHFDDAAGVTSAAGGEVGLVIRSAREAGLDSSAMLSLCGDEIGVYLGIVRCEIEAGGGGWKRLKVRWCEYDALRMRQFVLLQFR